MIFVAHAVLAIFIVAALGLFIALLTDSREFRVGVLATFAIVGSVLLLGWAINTVDKFYSKPECKGSVCRITTPAEAP